MKRTFDFGKIAYYGNRRENRVTVEVELRTKDNGEQEFSACGNVWNKFSTDIICGGQCLDEIANSPVGSNATFKTIYRLWKLYHLNGMHVECEHQAAAGWIEAAREEVTIYHYWLTRETEAAIDKTKKAIIEAAINGDSYQVSTLEKQLLNLEKYIKTDKDLPADIQAFYELHKTEKQCRGWIRYPEFESGILCKPCPVCGYQYGTKWLYRSIPEEDLKIINDLLNGDK